jgi:hypothetical protein
MMHDFWKTEWHFEAIAFSTLLNTAMVASVHAKIGWLQFLRYIGLIQC